MEIRAKTAFCDVKNPPFLAKLNQIVYFAYALKLH